MFVLKDTPHASFEDYIFPGWADALGWLVGASTLVPFVIGLAYHLIKGEVSVQRVMSLPFFMIFNKQYFDCHFARK